MPSVAPLLLSIHIRLRTDNATKRILKFPMPQKTLIISKNPKKQIKKNI